MIAHPFRRNLLSGDSFEQSAAEPSPFSTHHGKRNSNPRRSLRVSRIGVPNDQFAVLIPTAWYAEQ
jgi:hypothetical protein